MPDLSKLDDPTLDRILRVAGIADQDRIDIHSHIKGLMPSLDSETYPYPEGPGWVCFHCGQRFLTAKGAKLHFGENPKGKTICV